MKLYVLWTIDNEYVLSVFDEPFPVFNCSDDLIRACIQMDKDYDDKTKARLLTSALDVDDPDFVGYDMISVFRGSDIEFCDMDKMNRDYRTFKQINGVH